MPVNASNITILGPKSDSSSDVEAKTDLLLETFQGREALGVPYRYDLTILSKNSAISVADLLGKPLTVRFDRGAGLDLQPQYRYFNGIVTYFAKVGPTLKHTRYAVVLTPTLARLAYAQNCRIFNDASNAGLDPESGPPAQDTMTIVNKVLKQREVTLIKDLSVANANVDVDRRYCVQYLETDLNFVQRLLEDEGIYYFFTHEADKHTLVFANLMTNHDLVPGYDSVLCRVNRDNRNTASEHFWGLRVSGALYPSKYSVLRGYDYTANRAKETQIEWEVSGETQPGIKFEVYDYPGGLSEELQARQDAMVRMLSDQVANTVIEVDGNTLGLGVGDLVQLGRATDEHYNPFWNDADLDKKYLITEASYSVSINEHESGDTVVDGDPFTAHYTLLDAELQFRQRRTAFKPRIEGPQTAVVVGGGEEPDDENEDQQDGQGTPNTPKKSPGPEPKDKDDIYTDKLGRVKVKFDWDRSHRRHQKASCWVRVAQIWAGQNWGAIHIPRVGQEVIVEFLDGDPDRPIITGRVYNTDNPPPYTLPDNRTQSGIKSRSANAGTPSNFNEIRFEDLKGKEELHVQAERDMSTLVKRSQTLHVGGDQRITIHGNQTITVEGSDEKTGKKLPVQSVTKVTGKHTFDATETIEITAPTSITLRCKNSTIVMTPDAITLTSGGTAKVELTEDIEALAKGGAFMTLDETVCLNSNDNSILVLDAGASMASKDQSHVTLNADAMMEGKGKATVQGASEATVVAGGTVKTSPSGVDVTGTMVKIN